MKHHVIKYCLKSYFWRLLRKCLRYCLVSTGVYYFDVVIGCWHLTFYFRELNLRGYNGHRIICYFSVIWIEKSCTLNYCLTSLYIGIFVTQAKQICLQYFSYQNKMPYILYKKYIVLRNDKIKGNLLLISSCLLFQF